MARTISRENLGFYPLDKKHHAAILSLVAHVNSIYLQAIAQLKHHVTELVNMPVFNNWSGYLWQAGQSAMLLRKTRSNDRLKLWTVDLDIDSWTRIITGELAEGVIKLSS